MHAADDRLPVYVRELAKYAANPFAPLLAQRRKFGITGLEATPVRDPQTVLFVLHQVDRHRYRKIAPHRRIERNEHTLGGVGQTRFGVDDTVDDRFAVF